MAMAILGLLFGVAVALSIFLANLMAVRFSCGNDLFDIVIRLACVGALILIAAEVIGSLFGPEVRLHAASFWCAFAAGLVLVPVATALHVWKKNKRPQKKL